VARVAPQPLPERGATMALAFDPAQLHFFVNGTPVCARVDPATHAVPGEVLPLSADLNHMHLIEPETGRVV
jgi:hypothetical protein